MFLYCGFHHIEKITHNVNNKNTPSQMNPIHTLTPYFLKTSLDINLVLDKSKMRVWIGFIWLRIGIVVRLLLTRK
jgi:hypothetical protein